MANESIAKTFGVATVLCVVCAVIVSLSDVALKGMQQQNKALDKQVNILRAAGLVEPTEKISAARAEELFANATVSVVDLAAGIVEPNADPEAVEKDKTNVVTLDKDRDIASIKSTPAKTVVYIFNDASGKPETIVLPIKGTGLWSTLYGFLSLKGDFQTIAHIVFYDHGETPGLGGEISNPLWTAKWEGKQAYGDDGMPIVQVVKGTVDPNAVGAAYEVDGISGATLTGKGVTNTVRFWLGDDGFGRFLKNLRSGVAQTPTDESQTNEAADDGDVSKD